MRKYKKKDKILIFGVSGQDGSILAKEYLKNKFEVYGVFTSGRKNYKNLKKLGINKKIKILNLKNNTVDKIIVKTNCKKIFFFSGVASVTQSDFNKNISIKSNNELLIEILEVIRNRNLKNIKILNASSSEIFGKNYFMNIEESELNPVSYYGVAKSISTEIVRAYRLQFKIKVFNAILFNHESPLRPKDYVIKKIIYNVKQIHLKKSSKIKLGNLEVSRDWGWATEYVNIMKKIINLNTADDFIICTGHNYKLREVVNLVFSHYNLNYKNYVYQSKNLLRLYEVKKISGSNKKLFKTINYKPKIFMKEILSRMINNQF
tara:strand:- start:167 stop:1123 length:957 start_codon:yes stop_codon:yes gene_type:complete